MDANEFIKLRNTTDNFGVLTGVKIISVADGAAQSQITIEERHKNPMGIAHGGVICTLIDTTAGMAAASLGNYITTSSINIHFMRPAPAAHTINCSATPMHIGKKMLVHEAEVRDETGALLAKATVTNIRLDKIDGL